MYDLHSYFLCSKTSKRWQPVSYSLCIAQHCSWSHFLHVFPVDPCHSYCVTRNMVAENQSSSECITSRQDSEENSISLTSSKDVISANCCSAGTPRPLVSWEYCALNSTNCTALTTATQSAAELKLTGNELPEGDGVIRCVGEYLDVTEDLWTILLHVRKLDNGKTRPFLPTSRTPKLDSHFEKICGALIEVLFICVINWSFTFCTATCKCRIWCFLFLP